MFRRLTSLLIVCALMACFGAMLPAPASASVQRDMPAMTASAMTAPAMTAPATPAGCMHHHGAHRTCHDCPICAGVDLPRLATWDNRMAKPAGTVRATALVASLTGVRAAGLDRPPRHQG